MAIADIRNSSAPTTVKGPPCSVCQLLHDLPPEEAHALRELLSDKLWRFADLAEALRGEGHQVGAHTLARHVGGKCSAATKMR